MAVSSCYRGSHCLVGADGNDSACWQGSVLSRGEYSPAAWHPELVPGAECRALVSPLPRPL